MDLWKLFKQFLVQSISLSIRVVNFVYELIFWPLHYMMREDRSLPITAAAPIRNDDPTAPWRNIRSFERLTSSMYPDCVTLDDLWYRAVKLWPDAKCQGTRKKLSCNYELQSNGKTFKKLSLGAYFWETYSQVDSRTTNFGSGLLSLGLKPGGEDRIAVYSETRSEWFLAAQACFRYNIPLVTLYATLGHEAIIHGINQSEAKFVITSDELLPTLLKTLDQLKSITHIIFLSNGIFGGYPSSTDFLASVNAPEYLQNLKREVKILEITAVEKVGREHRVTGPQICKPQLDDLAIIMYTSGSTGLPKGVEISHRNLMCATSGMLVCLPLCSRTSDLYIAYLPLAHVLELCCELVMLSQGIAVGYSSPQTLTDNGTALGKGVRGDVVLLKPTLFTCVPTILDRLRKTVWEKVNEGRSMGREFFKWAYHHKKNRLYKGYHTPFLDRLVFNKVRQILGGNVRYMLSGGAPLSSEAQEFINVCFCKIIQGYGLTETCGSGTLMTDGDTRSEQTGPPLSCLEIKLRAWEEGDYLPTDQPYPRGEILIGGDCVTRGYYKDPEKTAEDFITDSDGKRWFCTGDIGQFYSDGCLSIIDRKKDLVKLQAGEYVSLGKVELALSSYPLVESVCVYGDSYQHKTICFIVPKKKALAQLALDKCKLSIEEVQNHEKLCQNEKVIKFVLKDIQNVAREKKLQGFEIPAKVHLDCDSWTPESGLVTDAFKLKRRAIQEHFQSRIDDMYSLLSSE